MAMGVNDLRERSSEVVTKASLDLAPWSFWTTPRMVLVERWLWQGRTRDKEVWKGLIQPLCHLFGSVAEMWEKTQICAG